ncbi:MAG: hypothetical protein WD009_06890, partial [Phycisphaeraceae bacterium]
MAEADEPLDDRELPDAADMDDEEAAEDTGTAPCPACGAMIYEDALQCPVCGRFVEWRDATDAGGASLLAGRAWWWIALAAAG